MKSHSRAGFTLVELMVAMALTLFLLVVLSQAFILSLEAFSQLKAIGDMQSNLRAAETLLRDDLSQDHFTGKLRLSDVRADGSSMILAQPPQEGFFAVRQSSVVSAAAGAPYAFEGLDVNNMPSYRATDHFLYMTVKRKGNNQQNFFTTALNGPPAVLGAFFAQQTAYNMNPGVDLPMATLTPPYVPGAASGHYASQWAEVLYFLVRTGSTEEPKNPASTNGLPTYSLYRAQFVMTPNATNVNTVFTPPAYTVPQMNTLSQSTFGGMSCQVVTAAGSTSLKFFSPADAAQAQRVIPDLSLFNVATNPRVANLTASTLVLPNVVSFHVQIMPIGAAKVNFEDVPGGVYDTAIPAQRTMGLKAIKITMRVWDSSTRQARQVSIVQDM